MDLSGLLQNTKAQEDQSEQTALPQGTYDVKIEAVEGKTNEQTGSKGVSLKLRVFGPKFNNYCLFDYMLIQGNEKALEYSLPKLKKIGVLLSSEDTSIWIGKSVRVRLSVDKRDTDRNIIWGYHEFVGDDNTPVSSDKSKSFDHDSIPF